MKSPFQSLILLLLRGYKLAISPFLGQNCRFYPSCSVYADIAIRRHGVVKGSVLAGKRLCKCHPWHSGGIDLVPEIETNVDQHCDQHGESGLKLARPEIGSPVRASTHVTTPPSNQPQFTTE